MSSDLERNIETFVEHCMIDDTPLNSSKACMNPIQASSLAIKYQREFDTAVASFNTDFGDQFVINNTRRSGK